jgi:hypothetical protein
LEARLLLVGNAWDMEPLMVVFCELAIAGQKQKEAMAQATEQRIAWANVARTRRKLLEISV